MADELCNCKLLQGEEARRFAASLDTFIFDCDGVLWNSAGTVDGAVQVIQCLRKLGKKVFFVTNNSSKSRAENVKKFKKFGIEACEEEIYGTAYAAAYYLKEILKFDKKAYIIGTAGLVDELDAIGIPHIGSGPDHSKGGFNMDEWTSFSLDPDVGAVISGFDEFFSFHKLIKAASYLARDSCIFIATNRDDRFPLSKTDVVVPGTGCLVTAVEAAARRKAITVGKPEKVMFDCIRLRHGIDPSKTCMVGDRLDTDIIFGNSCGLKTLLVLTGISSLSDVSQFQNSDNADHRKAVPNFYVPSIKDLLLPLESLQPV